MDSNLIIDCCCTCFYILPWNSALYIVKTHSEHTVWFEFIQIGASQTMNGHQTAFLHEQFFTQGFQQSTNESTNQYKCMHKSKHIYATIRYSSVIKTKAAGVFEALLLIEEPSVLQFFGMWHRKTKLSEKINLFFWKYIHIH